MQSECQHEEGQEQEQPSSFYEFEINKYEHSLHTSESPHYTQQFTDPTHLRALKRAKHIQSLRAYSAIHSEIIISCCKHLWFDHSLYLNPIPLKHINILKK